MVADQQPDRATRTMLTASDPNKPRRRRRSLPQCPHCGGNGTACDSVVWLRGTPCCTRYSGDHYPAEEATP